jgi:hypothetical protein
VSRMPDPMFHYEDSPRAERVEVITSVQRRRRWSREEKVRIVEETYLPGARRVHISRPAVCADSGAIGPRVAI